MSDSVLRAENDSRIEQLDQPDAVAVAHALAHDHDPEFVQGLLDVLAALRREFAWFGSQR